MKHCIVTPDIMGPVNNGGIGTHCHWFARLLAEEGRQVTILFTGTVGQGDERRWRDEYRSLGIDFVQLDKASGRRYQVRAFKLQQNSYDVFRFLEGHSFDVVHFQEWQANGLQTLQARRTLGAFPDTCITVTMHSNTRWIAEGGDHWYRRPLENAVTSWAEAFMARNADMVLSPSTYMVDWVRAKGWHLSECVDVIPVCSDWQVPPPMTVEPEEGVIAFFGRLETRKGLVLFLKALGQLRPDERALVKCVHFVGKVGVVQNRNADMVIRQAMSAMKIPFEIHRNLARDGALALLRQKKATVFIPSLADNYPLTVVEAVGCGLPVYASRVGGIPEILGDKHLFDPTPPSLARCVSETLAGGQLHQIETFYHVDQVREQWLSTIARCEDLSKTARIRKLNMANEPFVSICVPYYNYANYLPKMLESLLRVDYTNLEIIIIDDGSPDPRAKIVFDQLKITTTDRRVRFERQANAGVGAARNAAARLAHGDYLIFMDSDNLAKPEMIAVFMQAMERSGADIVTCYFDAFEEHREPQGEADIHHVYAPAGPAVEVGWAENVFGDANFCIKRSVFEALGGFGVERDSSWEDWEFLARAALDGRMIEVVPRSLFWYRYTGEGFSRNTDRFKNERRVLRPYLDAVGPDMALTVETMRQSAFAGSDRSTITPAGVIAAQVADWIYRKLGSPEGAFARALERFWMRILGN